MSNFPTYDLERLVPQTAKITEFPGCVLIEVLPVSSDKVVFAMRTEDFAAMTRKWKGTDFVFETRSIPHEMFYHGVIDNYLDDYVHRPQWQSEIRETADIRACVEAGAFRNIVLDFTTMDGYLYDLNGDPVYRSFRVELGSARYRTSAIREALRPIKKVKELFIEEVPYYNRDSIGKYQVEFNYYPDPDEFYKLAAADLKDGLFGVTSAIIERLGLEKFECERDC